MQVQRSPARLDQDFAVLEGEFASPDHQAWPTSQLTAARARKPPVSSVCPLSATAGPAHAAVLWLHLPCCPPHRTSPHPLRPGHARGLLWINPSLLRASPHACHGHACRTNRLRLWSAHVTAGPALALTSAALAPPNGTYQDGWPQCSTAPSRTKIWSNWAVVVSWAIAWPRVDSILPMPTDILKAFTWELLCTGTSRSVTIAFWSSVQTRHKVAGLKPLIIGAGEVSAWTRCLASLCLLRDQRDRLMVCDIWFGFHTGSSSAVTASSASRVQLRSTWAAERTTASARAPPSHRTFA